MGLEKREAKTREVGDERVQEDGFTMASREGLQAEGVQDK